MFTQDGPDLIQGIDFEHWVVVTDARLKSYGPQDKLTDFYIELFTKVVGSEEEARKKMYSVYTNQPCCAFGVHVSQEVGTKLNELDDVRHVLPDSYMDVANKRYPGEPFINGQAVPYHPKYYEEQISRFRKQIIENTSNIQSPNCDKSRAETRKIVVPPCAPDLPQNNRYSRPYNDESCMSRSPSVLPDNFSRPNTGQPQSNCGVGVQPGYAGEPGNEPGNASDGNPMMYEEVDFGSIFSEEEKAQREAGHSKELHYQSVFTGQLEKRYLDYLQKLDWSSMGTHISHFPRGRSRSEDEMKVIFEKWHQSFAESLNMMILRSARMVLSRRWWPILMHTTQKAAQ